MLKVRLTTQIHKTLVTATWAMCERFILKL
nr:MAG TPA: hypothetical protein [Caudoviricetes sp.]